MRRIVQRGVAAACFSAVCAAFAAPRADASWLAKIRGDHPRLFFNADTWPELKQRAETTARVARDRLLERCEAYPADPVCSGMEYPAKVAPTPSATPISDVRDWSREAADCALAWRLTGRSDFLEKAKRMLRVSGPAWRQAYANRRAVSWYGHGRILAFCAYDWIHDALSAEERNEILYPMVRHAEEVQARKGGPYILRCNQSGVQSGYYGVAPLKWYAGLAAHGDGVCDALARSLLVAGHDEMFRMLAFREEGAGDDGPLSSGVLGYAMGEYPWAHFNFFHTWRSATGENLAASYPGIGLFPNFVWWNWIPVPGNREAAREFGFGDTPHRNGYLGLGGLYTHLVQYENFFRDAAPDAARLAATLAARTPDRHVDAAWPMYPFLYDGTFASKPFTDDELARVPKARHFETAGEFIFRSGWTPDATYALFTAGAKLKMHKHYDECNFVIYKHDYLALDTGSRARQTDWNLRHYYAQTVAHNCLLVHKPGEKLSPYWGTVCKEPGADVNDGGQVPGQMARVVAFETTGAYSYVAADAAPAYGAKCRLALRQFVHLLPDFFVVYDRVVSENAAYRKDWLLHFAKEPELADGLVRADNGNGRLFCQSFLPRGAKFSLVGGEGREFWSNGRNWPLDKQYERDARKSCAKEGRVPGFGAWRLEVTPAASAREDRFLHVLTATDVSAAAPVDARYVEERGREGVVIVVPDYVVHGKKGTLEAKILFDKTGAAGGLMDATLRDADGMVVSAGMRPFATSVQPQAGVFPGKAPCPAR